MGFSERIDTILNRTEPGGGAQREMAGPSMPCPVSTAAHQSCVGEICLWEQTDRDLNGMR